MTAGVAMAKVSDQRKRGEVEGEPVALADKTCCLIYSFGLPGNSKKLKESQFTAQDADKKMIRANKILLDSKELKAIANADGELRTYLDTYCLPYPNRAVKLIPWGKVIEVDEVCARYERRREDELVPAFMEALPTLYAAAEARLGRLFNPADYPDPKDVLKKFKFRYQILNFGIPDKLRELKKEIYRNEQKKARIIVAEATDEIVQVRRAMFLKLVEHLKDRLSDDKTFRDTTVTKLQEFIGSFDTYNVADDEEGRALVQKAKKLVAGVDPDSIRTTETLKDQVLAGMEDISEKLKELVEDKPTRKFRLVKK